MKSQGKHILKGMLNCFFGILLIVGVIVHSLARTDYHVPAGAYIALCIYLALGVAGLIFWGKQLARLDSG